MIKVAGQLPTVKEERYSALTDSVSEARTTTTTYPATLWRSTFAGGAQWVTFEFGELFFKTRGLPLHERPSENRVLAKLAQNL